MPSLVPSAPHLFADTPDYAYVEKVDPIQGARAALSGFRDSLGEQMGKALRWARGGNREILQTQMATLSGKTEAVLAAMNGTPEKVQGPFDALADFLTNDFLAPFMGYTRDGKRKLGTYLKNLWEGLLGGLDTVREHLAPQGGSLKIFGLRKLVAKQAGEVFHMSVASAAAVGGEEVANGSVVSAPPPPPPSKKSAPEKAPIPKELIIAHAESLVKSLDEEGKAFNMFDELQTKTNRLKTAFQGWLTQLDPAKADFERQLLGVRPLAGFYAALIVECHTAGHSATFLKDTEQKLIRVFFGSICPIIALLPARSRLRLDVFTEDGTAMKMKPADYLNYSFRELPGETEADGRADDMIDDADHTDEVEIFNSEDASRLRSFSTALTQAIPLFKKNEPGSGLAPTLLREVDELVNTLQRVTGPVILRHLEEAFNTHFLDFLRNLQNFLFILYKKARENPEIRPLYRLLETQFLEDIYPLLEKIPEDKRGAWTVPFFVENQRRSMGLSHLSRANNSPINSAPESKKAPEATVPPAKSRWKLPAGLTALAAGALAVLRVFTVEPSEAVQKVSLESEAIAASAPAFDAKAFMEQMQEPHSAIAEPSLPEGSILPQIPDQPSSVWSGVHEALAACQSQGSTNREINQVVEEVLAKNSQALRQELEQHVWGEGAGADFDHVKAELQTYGFSLGGAHDFEDVLHKGNPHQINQAASFFTTPTDHYGMIASSLPSPFVCP